MSARARWLLLALAVLAPQSLATLPMSSSLAPRVVAAQAPPPVATPSATPVGTPAAAPAGANLPDQPWLNIRDQRLLDLDADGGIDAMRLRGYWNSGKGDTLTVYAVEGDLPPVEDYRVALDFDRTIWVFDPRSEERATLIVRFAREGDRSVAYLWDDQNGDGRVAHDINGRQVTVTESPFWSMKVWADGDWLRPDGTPNLNLHALFDGCGSCQAGGAKFPPPIKRAMVIDGQPDYAFDIVDADDDGIPEYRTRRILTPISDSAFSLPFFNLMSNEAGIRPAPIDRYIFWPLLAPTESPVEPVNYFDTAPFIPVDWRRGSVGLPLLVGYPIEHGFHLNSHAQLVEDDDPKYVNFENPMAYYDLAADRDGFPEMHVRFEYGGAHDPILLRGQSSVPQEDVRYSWNQDNERGLLWNYKIGLSGRHEIETTSRVGDLNLKIVPFADVPTWVTEREWDVATLVSVEGEHRYTGSEGIYEWNVNSTATRPFFAGLSTFGPSYEEIPRGLRGEFRTAGGRPDLYIDPLDGKLHLLGADGGVWNAGDGREIRSLNLDGGETVDGWQVWDHGLLTSQLYRVPGGLLFSDETETLFREVAASPDPVRTLPPTTHDEWLALGKLLETHALDVPGDDLRGLFERVPGETVALAHGPAAQFRAVADGFRVALDAAADPTRSDLAALTGSRPEPGPQVVSRVAGDWAVTAASYALPTVGLDLDAATASSQMPLHLNVTNGGTMDLGAAIVEVVAVDPNGNETLVGDREVTFDDGGAFAATLVWAPLLPGEWRLTAAVRRPSPDARSGAPVLLTAATQTVTVGPGPQLPPGVASTLGWQGGTGPQLLVLLGFAGLTGAIASIVLRRSRRAT